MAFLTINFYSFWNNNLPKRKRTPRRFARGKVYMKPLQWLHDILFGSYLDGDFVHGPFDILTDYSAGDRVKYGKAIYECWVPCLGVLPTVSANWVLVQEKFTGLNGRLRQNAQKLVFEYALNEWFGTTFRQPVSGLSDIYIQQYNTTYAFHVGIPEENSSFVDQNGSRAFEFVFGTDIDVLGSQFAIKIPVAVYNALGATSLIREKTVRRFADTINLAGIKYDIVTY